jgi:hypothetical protein
MPNSCTEPLAVPCRIGVSEVCIATTRIWVAAAVPAVAFLRVATAQDDLNPKNRQKLKREDVAGPERGGSLAVVEALPSELLGRHNRHGERVRSL